METSELRFNSFEPEKLKRATWDDVLKTARDMLYKRIPEFKYSNNMAEAITGVYAQHLLKAGDPFNVGHLGEFLMEAVVADRKLPPINPPAIISRYVYAFLTNPVQSLLSYIMAEYWRSQGKVYVIAGDFFNEFKNVSLEKLQFQHIPKELCGHIALPTTVEDSDGEYFNAVNFVCTPRKNIIGKYDVVKKFFKEGWEALGRPVIEHQWVTDETKVSLDTCENLVCFDYKATDSVGIERRGWSMVPRPTSEEAHIKDSFKNIVHTATAPGVSLTDLIDNNPSDLMNVTTMEDGYRFEERLVYNLLAYLKSGEPDLRDFRNQFRYRGKSETKVVREDKDLSRSDIVLVGYNYLKDPVYSSEGWHSKMHMGWRYCGPGRSQVKYTVISASEKRWRKNDTPAEEAQMSM